MQRVEKFVVVDRPIAEVYAQWTQFEHFPKFMAGVKKVRQLDATHLEWQAKIWGREKVWTAEITEQVPEQRISWKSISGAYSAGTVRFTAVDAERTRVRLLIAYDPKGLLEIAGNQLGFLDAQVQNAVDDFKTFIETRERPTGAWRGEVIDGRPFGGRQH
jgi:uncharacterized membrane protein